MHDQSVPLKTRSSLRVVDDSELATIYPSEELKVYAWADPKPGDFIALQEDFCQSRIDGRQHSIACGVIAMLHASKILVRRTLMTASFHPNVVSEFVRSMREGNVLYDAYVPDGRVIELQEALDMLPSRPLTTRKECRYLCSRTIDLMEKMFSSKCEAARQNRVLAAALSQSGMCVLLVFFPDWTGMVFDSHAHGPCGAALAKLPKYDSMKAAKVCEGLIGKITSAHLIFVFER